MVLGSGRLFLCSMLWTFGDISCLQLLDYWPSGLRFLGGDWSSLALCLILILVGFHSFRLFGALQNQELYYIEFLVGSRVDL